MFDIKIEKVNYYANIGEFPTIKAEVFVRDRDGFPNIRNIRRTWVFDVISYANIDSGVGPFELIIEEIVKNIWTALHAGIPRERIVSIDMYMPIIASSSDEHYMNELFTKYLEHERFRDNCARFISNSRLCLNMIPNIKTGELEIVPNRDIRTLFPETLYKDTDLADSIIDTLRYGQYDINMVLNQMKERTKAKEKIKEYEMKKIEKVIFNDPATIVFWRDGSKTVVKAQNEPFDKEKGLAMAIAKKAYGNEGNYYNEFKKFIKDESSVKVNSIEEVLEYLEPKEDKKNE